VAIQRRSPITALPPPPGVRDAYAPAADRQPPRGCLSENIVRRPDRRFLARIDGLGIESCAEPAGSVRARRRSADVERREQIVFVAYHSYGIFACTPILPLVAGPSDSMTDTYLLTPRRSTVPRAGLVVFVDALVARLL